MIIILLAWRQHTFLLREVEDTEGAGLKKESNLPWVAPSLLFWSFLAPFLTLSSLEKGGDASDQRNFDLT